MLFYPCDSREGRSVEATPKHLIIVDGAIMQAIPEHPKRDFIFCLSTAFGDAYLFQVIENIYNFLSDHLISLMIYCIHLLFGHFLYFLGSLSSRIGNLGKFYPFCMCSCFCKTPRKDRNIALVTRRDLSIRKRNRVRKLH